MSDKSAGPAFAPSPAVVAAEKLDVDVVVVPISNLPKDEPFPDDIPDEYKFEIFRLRREVSSLAGDNRRVNDKLTKALEALHDELRFWKLGIYERQWETLGQVMRRMRHLEAMIRALENPTPVRVETKARGRL
jgi:hypothetical protein